MHAFKTGDYVTRIGDSSLGVKTGKVYRVSKVVGLKGIQLEEFVSSNPTFTASNFRLATNKEISSLYFDMKNNNWMVYADKNNYKDVYDWIVSLGFNFEHPVAALAGIYRDLYENGESKIAFLMTVKFGALLYTSDPGLYEDKYSRIDVKPTRKTVTYEVVWPTAMTQKEKDIQAIEETIKTLQEKISELKAEK